MRDLAVGELAERFWRADGWRRLGYATESQYARERMGMSLSSVKAKRALARHAKKTPRLSSALANGDLGYEAARLVASVATPSTVDQWVVRAKERTVRYLREEVDVVQNVRSIWRGVPVTTQRNDHCRACGRRESYRELLSAARRSGRVTLRFWLPAQTRRYFRWLERLFAAAMDALVADDFVFSETQRSGRVSFVRFPCVSFIAAWKHTPGSVGQHAEVYARDHYRCSSPVCGRSGITPHHLKFRSAGGGDSAENIASLCVWCHLEGIHGGRLRASPPASDIAWSIERIEHTRVRGRRREPTAQRVA